VIYTRTHATLVEVAHRGGKDYAWAQQQAEAGLIPTAQYRADDGWVVSRQIAEQLIKEWNA
jgi:hypothetical protein